MQRTRPGEIWANQQDLLGYAVGPALKMGRSIDGGEQYFDDRCEHLGCGYQPEKLCVVAEERKAVRARFADLAEIIANRVPAAQFFRKRPFERIVPKPPCNAPERLFDRRCRPYQKFTCRIRFNAFSWRLPEYLFFRQTFEEFHAAEMQGLELTVEKCTQ